MADKLNEQQIKGKAATLRERLGGSIFGFPIHDDNPHSPYAVVVYAAGHYHVYPEAKDISFAALGVKTILEQLQKRGLAVNYTDAVRLISYEAQINAPDVTMRRLRDSQVDYSATEDGTELINGRGALKMAYFGMVDDKNPKCGQLMEQYYKLLASRRYGKTAAAIKQEVRKMNRDQAAGWIERTYAKYFKGEDITILELFQSL
ncbi:hypothetical protein [Paenibacillus sp. DMB5]|uniref:hypothetical protein n=1 Tax=Paenibacillus sp. DMB5 TaxID=1780103 RepID=UPI00076BD7BD|nr:hypothetical protein [Paenibacillus sp. DMB5]KUP23124.1 hypothetical protein AWJ19_22880 [Paenibacillus sp. DMB5]